MRAADLAWVTALCAALASCGGGEVGAAASARPSASAPLLAPPASGSGPSYEAETGGGALELLKFTFTSGLKGKDPADKLTSVKPGQRVYAHLTLRNRSGRPRKVHVEFTVNGNERTSVDLDVESSWSWRTWAYNTVLPSDGKGTLELLVSDEEGNPLVEESLPIKP